MPSYSTRPWPRTSSSAAPSAPVRKIRAHFLKDEPVRSRAFLGTFIQATSASWPIASRCRCLTSPTAVASRVSFRHISSKANQSAHAVSANVPMVGDIAVFQHTPMATYIDVWYTTCTGEENSRTFPQRRTSPLTRFSAKCLQAISASWPIASRCRCLTPGCAVASLVSFQHISSYANHISSVANQSAHAISANIPSADIAVFRHTPMARINEISRTKCTGEENSRIFIQRRTSPLTLLSANFLQSRVAELSN